MVKCSSWRAWFWVPPLGLGALGVGFLAQGLMPGPSGLSGPLLETMLESPPAMATPKSSAQEDLQGVAAERAARLDGTVSLAEPARGTPLNLEIRVALLERPPELRLGADGPWWLRRRDGSVWQQGTSQQEVVVSSASHLPGELWLETTPGRSLHVQGRAYAGRLRLVQQESGLLAVNHLPLETYVASVVGAEMPSSWDREALKAQAVAARSYALAHMARPASAHWHLGDNTRWQAYRGLQSSSARTVAAAAATAGLILSYQGGIVESLYAANSQISWEAHGQLGASMSQEGAQALASQGLRYGQILARYYPGASLARLRMGPG